MIPLKLHMKNFTSHSNSILDFTRFDAALIVGSHKGNPDISNGVGKSAIFNAIRWGIFYRYFALWKIFPWGFFIGPACFFSIRNSLSCCYSGNINWISRWIVYKILLRIKRHLSHSKRVLISSCWVPQKIFSKNLTRSLGLFFYYTYKKNHHLGPEIWWRNPLNLWMHQYK